MPHEDNHEYFGTNLVDGVIQAAGHVAKGTADVFETAWDGLPGFMKRDAKILAEDIGIPTINFITGTIDHVKETGRNPPVNPNLLDTGTTIVGAGLNVMEEFADSSTGLGALAADKVGLDPRIGAFGGAVAGSIVGDKFIGKTAKILNGIPPINFPSGGSGLQRASAGVGRGAVAAADDFIPNAVFGQTIKNKENLTTVGGTTGFQGIAKAKWGRNEQIWQDMVAAQQAKIKKFGPGNSGVMKRGTKIPLTEKELLKTTPIELNPFYKKKVYNYFNYILND